MCQALWYTCVMDNNSPEPCKRCKGRIHFKYITCPYVPREKKGTPEKRKYDAVHKWAERKLSKVGVCSSCNERKRTQWSNKDHLYNRLVNDWQELCHKCHLKYDVEVLGSMSMQEKGRIGGSRGRTGGFFANSELAREAGRKGGHTSRRTNS